MPLSRLLLMVTCAMLLACTQSDLTRREALLDQQVVIERVNAWQGTMNNARIDSLLTFYHQEPNLKVMWADGRRTEGWEPTEQAIRDLYGSIQYMNFVISELEVQVLARGIAQATFRHSTDVVGRDNRRLPVASGHGLLIWMKDQDQKVWKIHTADLAVTQPATN
ncbi:MAG: hypothetical protein OEZ42_05835 [Gemmatimonadota bacterium]|nr:hypothetical protein [Gemmatimonadota bacterium]